MKKDISTRRDEERESGVNLINNAELFRGDQTAAGAAYFMSNFTLQNSQALSTFWYTHDRISGENLRFFCTKARSGFKLKAVWESTLNTKLSQMIWLI